METIEISDEQSIVIARQTARRAAEELGYSIVDKTRIATAVSELARNVYTHGGGGKMKMEKITKSDKIGLKFIFLDEGPGIENINQAMEDGFTTKKGLGHGLPGSKRLMDEFKVESEVGKGTSVEVIKWKN